MKSISTAIFASLMTATGFAAEKPLQKTWLKGTTDKPAIFYNPGETMVFTIEPQEIKGELPEGQYFLQWERTGDDGIAEKGKEPFTGKPFVYKTSIDKPGFVRLCAQVVDAKGKLFKKEKPESGGDHTSPEGQRAPKKERRHIFFDGGAAAGIDTLAQGAPEPADFDEFWTKQKAELAKVPFNAKRVERANPKSNAKLYAVSIDCIGGMPVTGYLSIPIDTFKKYPVQIGAFGYGVREQLPPKIPSTKAIQFKMNAHGFLLREFGGTDEYYKTYSQKISSNGYSYAFDPVQNSNPETAYFRGMILRLIRAIQYAKTLPEWDGENLEVSGRSQGGAFAIWGAGCGEGVTRVTSAVTGFCDVGKELAGRLQGKWPRIKYVQPLCYFDTVNFAKRVPSSCRVDISYAGLGDYTCEPSGIAILWNNLKCPKTITWMQGTQHSYTPPKYEGRDIFREEP